MARRLRAGCWRAGSRCSGLSSEQRRSSAAFRGRLRASRDWTAFLADLSAASRALPALTILAALKMLPRTAATFAPAVCSAGMSSEHS